MPKAKTEDTKIAAAFLMRLAALLKSGVTLLRALEQLSEEPGEVGKVSERVRLRGKEFNKLGEAFAAEKGAPWRVVAAAWEISARAGAPMAETAERLSASLLSLEKITQKRSVIMAGPRATILLISLLPFVAVVVAEMLGMSLLYELTRIPGIFLLTAGILFLVLGIYWSSIMVREVTQKDTVGGLEMDLLWIALASGRSIPKAVLLVADTVDRFKTEWVPLDSLARSSPADEALQLALKNGVPVRPVLKAEADNLRENIQTQIEKEAEQLGVRILLPLGIFVLPSFILIGVLPMLVGMLR